MVDETPAVPDPEQAEATPVCVHCFRPVEPVAHYCPHCGTATGRFTHYLPLISIPWQTATWGQAWRQALDPRTPWSGRILRLLMIVWFAPVLLVGLFFPSNWRRPRPDASEEDAGVLTDPAQDDPGADKG